MTPDEIKSNLKVSSNCVILEALEYINELETEIESITEKFNRQQAEVKKLHNIIPKMINTAKSEAIKEFGKLLIDNCQNGEISACDILDYVVEMVGESNDTK